MRLIGTPDNDFRHDDELRRVLGGDLGEELFRFCYRMLGSVHDAEDATQEVFIRVWQGIHRFEGRSTLRTWAFRVATNFCLDVLRGRVRRPASFDSVDDIDESASIQFATGTGRIHLDLHDGYVRKEMTHLALMAVLHNLSPNQRAAFLLRDVLGFSARDAAEAVQTTPTAITSALQHARRTIETRIRATEVSSRDSYARLAGLADAYVDAFEAADLDALLRLLTEDVSWSMPPAAVTFRGKPAVSSFLLEGPFAYTWRHLPVPGETPAVVSCYAGDSGARFYVGRAVDVLEVRAGRIARVTSFLDPMLLELLGLPTALSADGLGRE